MRFAKVLQHARSLPQRKFAAGEIVLNEGDPGGVLLVLEEGAVEVTKRNIQISTIADPGAVFGELSALLGTPYSVSIRTLRDSIFRVADDPLGFLHANAEIALEVATLLSRRLQLVTDYLTDVKEQFADRSDHLGMVDEVLDTLVHHQEAPSEPGSDRHPDPTVD